MSKIEWTDATWNPVTGCTKVSEGCRRGGMKERPIIMMPENAQKCHDGRKTMTRRIIKPQPYSDENVNRWRWKENLRLKSEWTYSGENEWSMRRYLADCKCPYGMVGDRLWIRESGWERPERTPQMLRDGADTWEPYYFDALLDGGKAEELKQWGFRRRPSIYMPRWACRTVLAIMAIRVERVQAITQLDAMHEGCDGPDHRANFYHLWHSIHGEASWDLNPWVWVLEFQVVPE